MQLNDLVTRLRRLWRLVKIAISVALSAALLLVAPPYVSMIISFLEPYIPARAGLSIVLALGFAVGLQWRPTRFLGWRVPDSWWNGLELAAVRLLGTPLAIGLLIVAGFSLAGWIPHYLGWPLWADQDQFAISAQAWDRGLLPYRDLPDFDFPAPIYQFWLVGKVFGWGNPAAFFAADVALVILLGWAMIDWSRQCFGGLLPGLVGYVGFLSYYLNLDYSETAQREWHASFCVVVGLLWLQARPGQMSRLVMAAGLAAALCFRPQAVLFVLAVGSALIEEARSGGASWSQVAKRVLGWSVICAIALGIAFAPLILAGVLGDFVRSLRPAGYGGSYNRVTLSSFLQILWECVAFQRVTLGLIAPVLVIALSPQRRRLARPWALAMIAAVFYKPISPVPHHYLEQPAIVIAAVSLALLVDSLLNLRTLRGTVKLLVLIALLCSTVVQPIPAQVCPWHCVRLLVKRARGKELQGAPPGCSRLIYSKSPLNDPHYRWEDYRDTLKYLRRNTTPQTTVANFLRHFPFPTINGMVGRLSPYPVAGGILWLHWINPGDENRFIASLEQARDCVVVWTPDEDDIEGDLRLERIVATIQRSYRFEAQFGRIQIWRRVYPEPRSESHVTSHASNPDPATSLETALEIERSGSSRLRPQPKPNPNTQKSVSQRR
jgi:hypothetical protein